MRIGVAPVLVNWWKTVGGMKTACPVCTCDALLAEAHFARAFDDEVDLFLLLVVPRHLAAVRLERDVAHGEIRGLDGAHAPDQVLRAAPRRVRAPGDLREICNDHDEFSEFRIAPAREIRREPRCNQYRAKLQRIDRPDRLRLIADHREHEQRQRRNADRDRAGEAAGHAVGPRQPGLANAQRRPAPRIRSRMLRPVSSTSSMMSLTKLKLRHSAHAAAQPKIATQGAPVLGCRRARTFGRKPSSASTAGRRESDMVSAFSVPTRADHAADRDGDRESSPIPCRRRARHRPSRRWTMRPGSPVSATAAIGST